MRTFILDAAGQPKEVYVWRDGVVDLDGFKRWVMTGPERVALDTLGHYVVSTMFLGLDHQFGEGPPMLWETMVFDQGDHVRSGLDLEMERYASKADALRGHAEMLDRVRMALKLEGDGVPEQAREKAT